MATSSGIILPCPEHYSRFEQICADLAQSLHRDDLLTPPQRHGRTGQRQHGVDIALHLNEGVVGIQCKLRSEALTEQGVVIAVKDATSFQPQLRRLEIWTTAPADAELERKVLSLSVSRVNRHEFAVTVIFWDRIAEWIGQFPSLLRQYFPDFFPGIPQFYAGMIGRLQREAPDTQIDIELSGKDGMTIHVESPRPLVRLTTEPNERGERVRRELELQRQSGLPVEFTIGDGVGLQILQPVLRDLIPGALSGSRLRLEPPETRFQVRLAVLEERPLYDIERFVRSHRRSLSGWRGEMVARPNDSAGFVAEVKLDHLPLKIKLPMDGLLRTRDSAYQCTFSLCIEGTPVGHLLEAERLLEQLRRGAYFGIFFDGAVAPIATHVPAGLFAMRSILHELEILNEIEGLTGWGLTGSIDLYYEDFQILNQLKGLLEARRYSRAAPDWHAELRLKTDLQVSEMSRYLETAQRPLTLRWKEVRGIDLLGKHYTVGVVQTTITHVLGVIEQTDAAPERAGRFVANGTELSEMVEEYLGKEADLSANIDEEAEIAEFGPGSEGS